VILAALYILLGGWALLQGRSAETHTLNLV